MLWTTIYARCVYVEENTAFVVTSETQGRDRKVRSIMDALDEIREQIEEMPSEQRDAWVTLMNKVFDGNDDLTDDEVREFWELAPAVHVSEDEYQSLLDCLEGDEDNER